LAFLATSLVTVCGFRYIYKLYVPLVIYLFIDVTVTFDQANYTVNEDAGVFQPMLILSTSSMTDITVQVVTSAFTTTGKQINFIINY